MRGRAVAMLMGILGAMAVGSTRLDAQVPDKEVDVVFHGLLAFVPDDNGMNVLYVNPPDAPHMAAMAIGLSRVVVTNTSLPPDFVISGAGAEGIGVWLLKGGFTLKDTNIDAPTVPTDFTKLNPGDLPDTYPERIRWVPHMADIFDGVNQALDLTQMSQVAAVGRFPVGQLLPIFDKDSHKTDTTHPIHKRQSLAIADGVLLKLKLKLKAQPIVFVLQRESGPQEVSVKGATEIRFSAYPLIASTTDFAHFHHFYDLRADKSPADSPATPPTPEPARCPPVFFCCNQ